MRRGLVLTSTLWTALRRDRGTAGYLGLVPRYNSHNLGDALMMPLFARELAPVRLYHMMQFRPVEHRAWRLACRRAFSACILGGGTLVFWRPFLDYLSIALDAGVPCFVLGTGVLDPEFWGEHGPALIASRDQWIQALKACRFVGVRGEASRRILADLGVEGVEVVGDPCLLLASSVGPVPGTGAGEESCTTPLACSRRVCTVPPPPENSHSATAPPVLGLNWGTSGNKVWGGDERRPMEELARAAGLLVQQGWRLRVYCVWPNDREAVKAFCALLPAGSWTRAEHFLSAEEFMGDVAGCTAFAGMKLHSTALALCAGVPSVMLEYRPKGREFMASVGLEDLSVRLDALDGRALADMLGALARGWAGRRAGFLAKAAELTARLRRGMAMVREAGMGRLATDEHR